MIGDIGLKLAFYCKLPLYFFREIIQINISIHGKNLP